MGDFGPWHLLIIAGVFVLLFGAKKLPDAARSLGKSARILKTELKDLHDDDGDTAAKQAVQQTAQLPAAPVTPPAVVVTEAPAQPVSTGDQTPAS
jgi:sec-independent protein translocase protein TatA